MAPVFRCYKNVCFDDHHKSCSFSPVVSLVTSEVAPFTSPLIHWMLGLASTSHNSAFSLPIYNEFVRITGSRLANHQLLKESVQLVIFDEKSMIDTRPLHKLTGALVKSVPEQPTNFSQFEHCSRHFPIRVTQRTRLGVE